MNSTYTMTNGELTVVKEKSTSVEKFRELQDEIYELFQKKNGDYGDAFKENGSIGTLIRIKEKVGRLKNFINIGPHGITYKKTSPNVVDESIRDTLMDLNSYTLMMLMLLDEESQSQSQSL